MMTKITIEAIAYSLIYSAFMLIMFKIQGTRKQLYNYPPAIKERALERGITTQEEMNTTAKKNKTIGLLRSKQTIHLFQWFPAVQYFFQCILSV